MGYLQKAHRLVCCQESGSMEAAHYRRGNEKAFFKESHLDVHNNTR